MQIVPQALPVLSAKETGPARSLPFSRWPWRLPVLVLLFGIVMVLSDARLAHVQLDQHQVLLSHAQAQALAQDFEHRVKTLQNSLAVLAMLAEREPNADALALGKAARLLHGGDGMLDYLSLELLADATKATSQVLLPGPTQLRPAGTSHYFVLSRPLAEGRSLRGRIDLDAWLQAHAEPPSMALSIKISGRSNDEKNVLLDTRTGKTSPALLYASQGSDAEASWEFEAWPAEAVSGYVVFGPRQGGLIAALVLLALYLWAQGKRQVLTEEAAKQAAQDVERSRDRWMRALDATQDGVWEFDAATGQFFTSQVFQELAGLQHTAGNSLRAFLRLLGKEQRRRTVSAIRAAWEEASRLDELVSFTGHSGQKRWLRIRGTVAKGRDYFTGAISDVTDEIELARERDRYQSFMAGVIDALPMPISVKGRDGSLILVNKLHAQSLNKMIGELVGKRANQLVDSKMAEQLEMLDRLVLETGRTHSLEDWFDVALARRRVFLRITKSRCLDENGQSVVVTTYEDQTEVRSYARRLADLNVKVQAFVQRLIETIPHPLYVTDAESRYLIVNASLADQWGMRVEDMIGRSSRELFGDERGGVIEEEDRRVLAGDVIRRQESVFHARTAQLRHWAVIKSPCLDVDGKQVIVGSNYELTEIRRAELDLRAALDQQSRMRAFLQETFDALPHPFFIKDRKHRYVMTNRAHAAFHDCSRDRIIGASSWDFATPEVAEAIEREEDGLFALAEGTQTESEYTLIDGSGRTRRNLVRKVLSRDAEGLPVLIGITIDVTRLMEAEARQARLRDFYQRLFDAIPLPVIVKDVNHRYQLVNKAFCEVYQRSVEEILGKGTWDFNSPDEAERAVSLDDELFNSPPGDVVEREQVLHYADGQAHEVVVRKVVYLGPDSERLMIAAHTDMSCLRAAERKQRGTLDRLTTLINNAPMGIALLRQGGGIVDANSFLQNLLGYSAEDLRAKVYQALIAPRFRYLDESKKREVLATGVLQPFEVCLLASDGREIPVVVSGVLVREQVEEPAYWILVTDLTEQKRVDLALHLSEARWQFALEGAGDAVWDWDVTTGQVFYSMRWKTMLGYREDETPVSLDEWRSRLYPDDVDSVTAEVQRHLDGLTLFYVSEHRMCSKNGTCLWVLDRGKVIERGADGKALRMIGTLSDITQRKQEETELRRHRDELRTLVYEQTMGLVAAKDAAEHANAAKTEFLANVSHELRTPMHAILSFARMGEERAGQANPEKLKDYFHRVVTSGDRLLNLLDELLDIAKLEAGRMDMLLQPGMLQTVIDDAVAEFDALLVARKIVLQRDFEADLPTCLIDAKRIGQVVRNLLSNAIKFTPDGGFVAMKLRSGLMNVGRRQGEIMEVRALELRVQDSGVGIPTEELENIFAKFVQSSLTPSASGGTGLGLAICKAIVQAHRGQIYARNREVGGAEFIVCLPVARQNLVEEFDGIAQEQA